MKQKDIQNLYYITHVDNLPSILRRGILPHAQIEQEQIPYKPIYDREIVSRRRRKKTPQGTSLWEYANLFLQPRNPMMYRVVHEKDKRDLAVVAVKPSVLHTEGVMITDGNAASNPTKFYFSTEGLKVIAQQWKLIYNEWWNELDGSKRKIMAECLVPGHVEPEAIYTIYVADQEVKDHVERLTTFSNVPIVPEPHMFFQPRRSCRIGTNISLIDGDMFFSNLHTLTVSVNLRGIMGKGLASRAKYQFPDVYVYYQDACRAKRLTATKPCIYKREASVDQELADLDTPLTTANSVKWFLLFATKRHWRENSRLEDIEGGLDWIRKNFKREGISSLAMPALGCGLGGLRWAEVGRLMCSYLHNIGIQVAIYLPREHTIEPKLLSEQYLLSP